MRYIIGLIFSVLFLTSCLSSNALWEIRKVELGNNKKVYLKSLIWGLRGEHARTIISENNEKEFYKNKDIDIGQFVPIRYRIENEKFILLESNNDGIRKQIKTEMENVEIRFVTSDEFLYSDKNIIEDYTLKKIINPNSKIDRIRIHRCE